VLITGAAGFIGSHLTESCLGLGWRVTALDAFTDYYEPSQKRANLAHATQHPDCRIVEADLLEVDLRSLLDEVILVFHLAAQPGVRASWEQFDLYSRRNIDATRRLLDAARGASLERLILASSSSVYGDAETLPTREDLVPRPISPYGVTKVACEHLARAYWQSFGVPTVVLRYFTVYGPRQRPDMAFSRLIAGALVGEPFEMLGDGEQTRDFTFVADTVDATIAAASRGGPGMTYNVGGGSRRSMNAVLDTLGEIMGSKIARRYREREPGDARDTAADINLAQSDLNYAPSCGLRRGLEAQLEWQRASAPAPAISTAHA
jgi:nucleoside-diphosphate-sugar epimerase